MTSAKETSPAEQLAALLKIVRSPEFGPSEEELKRRELGQQRLKERLSLIPYYKRQGQKHGDRFWQALHGSCILS